MSRESEIAWQVRTRTEVKRAVCHACRRYYRWTQKSPRENAAFCCACFARLTPTSASHARTSQAFGAYAFLPGAPHRTSLAGRGKKSPGEIPKPVPAPLPRPKKAAESWRTARVHAAVTRVQLDGAACAPASFCGVRATPSICVTREPSEITCERCKQLLRYEEKKRRPNHDEVVKAARGVLWDGVLLLRRMPAESREAMRVTLGHLSAAIVRPDTLALLECTQAARLSIKKAGIV